MPYLLLESCPVCPTYTLLHLHGVQYTTGVLRSKLSSSGLSILMIFFTGIWLALCLCMGNKLLILLELEH